MKLFLIRHGETKYNLERRAIGHNPVSLNTTGNRQALLTAEALAAHGPTAVYSSPLPRAMETAGVISEKLKVEVRTRDNLKEADIGLLDGLTGQEMRQRYPDFMKLWLEDPATAVMPQGECLQDVQQRAWQTLLEIEDLHPEESVAVVSHNFTIQTLICRILEMPLANFRRLQVGLGSITLVDTHRDRHTLVRHNDRCHLEGL